jgi:thiol:disulfide interchange protein
MTTTRLLAQIDPGSLNLAPQVKVLKACITSLIRRPGSRGRTCHNMPNPITAGTANRRRVRMISSLRRCLGPWLSLAQLVVAISVGFVFGVLSPCQLLAAAKTQASLILDKTSAKPGDVVWAGVRLQSPTGWHTYWQNAGESGAPTAVQWQLPPGISAGPLEWPVPEKYSQAGLTTFVYHDETILLAPLMIAADCALGAREIKAAISWLECETLCVPGDATVASDLLITNVTAPSAQASLIENWKTRLPHPATSVNVQTSWGQLLATNMRQLVITWETPAIPATVDFLPLPSEGYEVGYSVESSQVAPGKIRLQKTVKNLKADWPAVIHGVLAGKLESASAPMGYQIALTPQTAQASRSLWLMLLYALLGGVILNIMPCVLPVIALKILGFVNQSRETPGRVRVLGWLYTLGVLASFAALALAVIGVQQAGHRASWGMQFGNPVFLVVLCVLVTLVALNLFGVFEVTLSGRMMNAASELAAHEGKAGAFFNGVLATALATPCTAPFLGASLGFAFVQPPAIILLFFVTAGLGLALPYLILTWQPAWLQFLPKPGAWMLKFKIAMGFPMLATAFWLFSLSSTFYGKRSLWLGLFLVVVGFSAWIYGEWGQRGRTHQRLALAVALILLFGGYAYALETQLRWRQPETNSAHADSLQESPDGIAWRKWTPEAVAQARQDRRVVLVDFTADWCLTCNANKKFSLEIDAVRDKIKKLNAVALLADYTRPATAPEISSELQRFGRAGVPLVLVYPLNHQKPVQVLPELLTPQIVLHALETAAQP